MSKKSQKRGNRFKLQYAMPIFLLVLLLALTAVIVFMLRPDLAEFLFPSEAIPAHTENGNASMESIPTSAATEGPVQIETIKEVRLDLGNGLTIVDAGSYTGMYMEDGSDEIVSGVLMIMVTNNSDIALQYAQISLQAGQDTAHFSVTTLPAGESVVLLEENRMRYDKQMEYTNAAVQNVAWFQEPLSLCEDRLQIQPLDGALNITNISGQDISGEIVIYYKNSSADMLYGGITYRVRIAEGLQAGEIKQIISDHYTSGNSTVMFVTCG